MLGSPLGSLANSTPSSEADKRKNFRSQAIQEIISSEKTYLSQLEILMQYFVRPLKEKAIIDTASHTLLFGQIEMIHNLNGELLKELENDSEDVAKVCFIFRRSKKAFVGNIDNAIHQVWTVSPKPQDRIR